jgi:hypothetical protein
MSRPPVLTALAVAALVLPACTGDDPDATTTTTASTSTTTVPTSLPVAASLAGPLFSALAGRGPTAAVDAVAFTLPGSPAALFVDHRLAAADLVGERPAVLIPDGADFRVCATSESCVTFGEIVVEPATGRVSSFAVDGSPLGGRVVGAGLAADVDGVIARARSAYVTSADELTVVVEVSNTTDVDVEVFAFAAAYQPESSGGAVEATGWWGEPVVPAGSTGLLLLAFPDVLPGGLVRLTAWRGDAIDVALDLRVRPAG